MRSIQRTALLVAALAGAGSLLPVTAGAAVRKMVISDKVTIRSFPDEYVLGNATKGFIFDVQQPESNGYRWGFVRGDSFQGCAWIRSASLADTPDPNDNPAGSPCPTMGRTVKGFTNGEVRSLVRKDGKRDGVPRRIVKACPSAQEYLNVMPWMVPAVPGPKTAVVYKAKQTVRFRYTSADGQWAMVRNPRVTAPGQGWGFIRRKCLAPAGG